MQMTMMLYLMHAFACFRAFVAIHRTILTLTILGPAWAKCVFPKTGTCSHFDIL